MRDDHEEKHSSSHVSDMNGEEFRRALEAVGGWIARYMSRPEDYPVLSRVRPGEIRNALPKEPPEEGTDFESIFDIFSEKLVKGITHWNHPSFFAYFPCGASAPGMMGELLAAALGLNGMIWRTSPVVTELEEVALDYFRIMLGLEDSFSGVIMDTASTSTLCALAAARETLAELHIRERGMAGRADLPALRVYASAEAHSSIEKAAIVLGIGQENVVKIGVDRRYRMDPALLERAIETDAESGRRPFCVVATAGTTSSTSVDPVEEIARICEERSLWLHIDAAYAGSAAILPEKRSLFSGWDRADSIVINPHKWLFTQLDLSTLYFRDASALKRAFSLTPEYLSSRESGEARNLMDYGFQLGRRFRALKLWMVINYFGKRGLQALLRGHLRLADKLKDWIEESEDFELMAPVPFSTVCFRLNPAKGGTPVEGPGDEAARERLNRLNERLLAAVNDTGTVFLSHTKLAGNYVLRCSIGNIRTEEKHVRSLWELLNRKARELIRH